MTLLSPVPPHFSMLGSGVTLVPAGNRAAQEEISAVDVRMVGVPDMLLPGITTFVQRVCLGVIK